MAQAKSVKKSGSQERKEPYVRESIHTRSKGSKATKKSSWVDKDLKNKLLKRVLKREQNH